MRQKWTVSETCLKCLQFVLDCLNTVWKLSYFVSKCLIIFGTVLDCLRRRLNNTFTQKSIILVFFVRFMGGRWDILSVRKRGGSGASSRVDHRSFLVLSHLIVLASPMLSYFVSSLPSKKIRNESRSSKSSTAGPSACPHSKRSRKNYQKTPRGRGEFWHLVLQFVCLISVLLTLPAKKSMWE